MADHTLDRQVGIDRLADDIKTVQNQVSELRTLQKQGQDALDITNQGVQTSSVSLPDGGLAFFTFALISASGQTLFAMFPHTFYQGSVSTANAIQITTDYTWGTWYSYEQTVSVYSAPDIICVSWIKNNSGSTQTIYCAGRWRYIVGS